MATMFRKSQWLILLAFIFGALFAYISFPPLNRALSLIAELFLKALKLLSLPVIFLSIVSTITKIKNPKVTRILAGKVLKYTLFTTLLAASIGLLLFVTFHRDVTTTSTIASTATSHSYLDTIRSIIPSNIVEPFLENNVLGVAFLATILSIALLKVESKEKETVTSFFSALFQSMLKISSFFITLLPIGICAFTFEFFRSISGGGYDLQKITYYTICVLGANLIQGCIILPLILKRKGISPINAFRKMSPALAVAFFSKSSNAALPLTLERSTKGLGVRDETAQFSIPLCSVINMNGCAAFILITTLFVATSEGLTFTLPSLLAWIPIATLVAIGNAGVPMGCFFLTSALLVGMNVPLTLMGLILPLYTIFDMVETALNVWSDSVVTLSVDKEMKAHCADIPQ